MTLSLALLCRLQSAGFPCTRAKLWQEAFHPSRVSCCWKPYTLFFTERTCVYKQGTELPVWDQIIGSDGVSGNQEEIGKRLTTITQTEKVSLALMVAVPPEPGCARCALLARFSLFPEAQEPPAGTASGGQVPTSPALWGAQEEEVMVSALAVPRGGRSPPW